MLYDSNRIGVGVRYVTQLWLLQNIVDGISPRPRIGIQETDHIIGTTRDASQEVAVRPLAHHDACSPIDRTRSYQSQWPNPRFEKQC